MIKARYHLNLCNSLNQKFGSTSRDGLIQENSNGVCRIQHNSLFEVIDVHDDRPAPYLGGNLFSYVTTFHN